MILIFGGAYQGKTDYAKSKFNIKNVYEYASETEANVAHDTDKNTRASDDKIKLNFDADCITGIENFVFACVRNGVEAKDYFAKEEARWKDKILVITDTSQGVVPIDKNARAAREMNGRLMLYLAEQAEQVHRVFCGIGKRIK